MAAAVPVAGPTGPEHLFSGDEVDSMVTIVKNIRTAAVPTDVRASSPERIAT